jgi:hypothetical protein
MAWVPVWRAVDNEEMTRYEALAPEWRLVHLGASDAPEPGGTEMEPRLRRLLDTSLTLFTRLGRLESRMMDA